MKPVLEQRRRNLLLDGRTVRCQVVDATLKRKTPAISEECSKKSRLRIHSSVQSNLHEQAVQQAKDDSEVVALEPAKVSLICPISNKRIQVPVRGENCTHPHCFDRSSFLRLNKKAMNFCPFAFCGQKIRTDGLVVDVLFNNALSDAGPTAREVELVDGTFKAAQATDTDQEVVDIVDASAVVMEDQVALEKLVDPVLKVGMDVLEALHDALESIEDSGSTQGCASEASQVQLSVAKKLHARSSKVFQLAAKHLQKGQDSMNPERPRASTSKQWLHDIAHETVDLHSLVKERVLGAPKLSP